MTSGCTKTKEDPITYTEINCSQMEKLVNEGAMLIDVREDYEYEIEHLKYAINYPSTTILNTISDEVIKTAPLIIYCVSGTRSKKVVEGLIQLGYTQVYDLGAMSTCIKNEN